MLSAVLSITDGVVLIRQFQPGDSVALIAGRDAEFHRFLGDGAPDPRPTACITVGDQLVGWVDYDVERDWLQPGVVNLGYNVFEACRGNGYAARAVQLLMHHLALSTDHRIATLLIDPHNSRSLALAKRTGFIRHGDLDGNAYFKRPVPPRTYSDGTITIRSQRVGDINAELRARDSEQMRWLWSAGQRDLWDALSPTAKRSHVLRILRIHHDTFGSGPKWVFSVDVGAVNSVAYVDCDLANDHVPRGEANISYAAHPTHRGHGYVSRSVRLVLRFLRENTGAREAHIIIDERNISSLRVAVAVGAQAVERWTNEDGHTLVRHVIRLANGEAT
jgi:RimJ/RimL family protein N-acetyltransferase